MTKFTLCLIVLGAVLKVNLAGTIGLHENRDQSRKNQVSLPNNWSALSGLLPDPKSGRCGRLAEYEDDKKVATENYINWNSENTLKDAQSESVGSTNDVEKKNGNSLSAKCIDIGGVINGVVNNVLDTIKDRVTTWISKFSDKKAEEMMSLNDEKKTFDKMTDNYGPNRSVLSSTGAIDFVPGKQDGLRRHPWLVRLTIVNSDDTMRTCGGSLISPRFVLTAADCVKKAYKSLDDIHVYLAEYNINTTSDCVEDTCIETVMMHPDKIIIHEDFGYKLNGVFNDIALMRLRESAPYTEYIRPICLPPFNIDVPKHDGTPLEVAGWGNTEHGPSYIKQSAHAQLVTHRQCKKYYSPLTPGQICAVGRTGLDICRGDTGGPLIMEKDGSFYLVGIMSGKETSSCGSSKPRFYTNVFVYTQWILDNMNV